MCCDAQMRVAPGRVKIQLRPNPHLKQTSHDSNRLQSKPSQGAEPVSQLISENTRYQFCLDVRGWALPTSYFFDLFEAMFKQKELSQQDLDQLRFWVDRGFGYAIGRLIESTKPSFMAHYQRMIHYEYPDTTAICPLACSYRDYISLRDSLDSDQIAMLQDACRPDCRLKQTISNPEDEAFCQCLVHQGAQICSRLSVEDIEAIKQSESNQGLIHRKFEQRMKRQMVSGDAASTIQKARQVFADQASAILQR
jgi:predicted DNA binding CopG/RHH family protein